MLLIYRIFPPLFLALVLGYPPLCHGHNGQLGLAAPISQITIDGDFSDWPADMVRYPITQSEYGNPPKGPEDFSGSFTLGYDHEDQALYIAVLVEDESLVVEAETAAGWNSRDGCEIYVELGHGTGAPIASQHVVYGEKKTGTSTQHEGQVESLEVRRFAGRHQYEWRLDLAGLGERWGQTAPWLSLGFDVVVCDLDEDGSFSWMAWGKGIRKLGDSERMGDLVPMGQQGAGTLTGAVKWRGAPEGIAAAKVRFELVDNKGLWGKITTDRYGVYRADLPAGTYQVEIELGRGQSPSAIAQVKEGRKSRTDFVVDITLGRTTEAGRGQVVPAGSGLRRGLWLDFGTPDGLVDGQVKALVQDREGALWIGTASGLVRYDGSHFTTFSRADGLADDQVNALLEDKGGTLWIGTASGLVRFDGKHFTTFSSADGLTSNLVVTLLEDKDGYLWVGTASGLVRYDGINFTPFSTADSFGGNQVNGLLEDRGGRLWIGTERGVFRFEDHGDQSAEQGDGEIGLVYSALGALGDIRSFSLSADEPLWVGTASGLVRISDDGIERFADGEGLTGATVNALLGGREGELWVGTSTGLSRYDGQHFVALTKDDGLPSKSIHAVVEDQEGLWIGTDIGLVRYEDQVVRLLTRADGLPDQNINALLLDARGGLWIGTPMGLSHWNGTQLSNFGVEDGLVHNVVNGLALDEKGNLWIGTQGGVSCFNEADGFVNFTTQSGLSIDSINSIAVGSKGQVWIGTWAGGLNRFDGEKIDRFTVEDGLVHNTVNELFVDADNNLWIGTEVGLSRFDGANFTNFTVGNGLANNNVQAIAESANGVVWIGTAGGLSRFDGTAFQSLLQRDGLLNNSINAVLLGRDGKGMWIATEGGMNYYLPHAQAPPIRITDVISDRRHGPVQTIKLATNQTMLAFEFLDLSLITRTEARLYRYRLRGYQDQWQLGRDRRVEYHALPAGNFTFEVVAIDRELSYSVAPARVSVEIHYPYGQIALWSLVVVALSLSAWLAGQIVKRNRSLNIEVAERKKAEAKQRRSLATERVRGVAFELNNSEESKKVIEVIGSELLALEIDFEIVGLNMLDAREGSMRWWEMHYGGEISQGSAALEHHPVYHQLLDYWQRKVVWERSPDAQFLDLVSDKKGYNPTVIIDVPYHGGTLAVGLSGAMGENGGLISLLQEFAHCLTLGYQRLENIEQRQQIEKRLNQNQKMEAIGQLAAGVAHEINTPMQFIGDNTQFLQDGFEVLSEILDKYRQTLKQATEEGREVQETLASLEVEFEEQDLDYILDKTPEALQESRDGVDRVRKIVKAMRDFSHPDSGEKEMGNINQIIERSVTVSRNAWKYVAHLDMHLDSKLPLVPCLPNAISQVIINLMVNAAQAIEDANGTGQEQSGQIDIHTHLTEAWVEVQVRDNGSGIPKHAQAYIFDPFYTTKEVGRGTGQGLAISYDAIVNKHGGELSFETEPGKGTTFFLRLPLEATEKTVTKDRVNTG